MYIQPMTSSETQAPAATTDADVPLLTILVISYNTREMTLECLRSVVRETRLPYELIVLDNDSPDGSAEAIAAEFPDIRLIASKTNYGFPTGNNVAAKEARGEYLLLLNPDTVVLDGAIDRLFAFSQEHPEAQIWGGRTLFGDGSLNATSSFRKMTLWSVFCHSVGLAWIFRGSPVFNSECYGAWQRDTVRHVDIVTGCFFLLRRKLWEDLGGFNLAYFMFGDEADLCQRAKRDFGADPIVTPDATIIHYGGASQSVRADRVVLLTKARLTLVRDHFPAWQKPLARTLIRLSPFVRMVAARLAAKLSGKEKHARAARNWGDIWARRGEWWDGYAPVR